MRSLYLAVGYMPLFMCLRIETERTALLCKSFISKSHVAKTLILTIVLNLRSRRPAPIRVRVPRIVDIPVRSPVVATIDTAT